MAKIYAQYFAVFKYRVVQGRPVPLHQAQIAIFKNTINKLGLHKLAFLQVAFFKCAVIEFAAPGGLAREALCVKDFVVVNFHMISL